MASKNIIADILEKAEDEKFADDFKPMALRWFKRYITSNYKVVQRRTIREMTETREVIRPKRGGLYTFRYVPKGKKTLPYWDQWPLVMPFRRVSGGKIHAFNWHYLPPKERIITLFRLSKRFIEMEGEIGDEAAAVEEAAGQYYDLNTLDLRYDYTKRGGLTKLRRCVRTYIISNISAKLIEFPTQTWPVVCFLPIAQWRGPERDKRKIWKDAARRSKY